MVASQGEQDISPVRASWSPRAPADSGAGAGGRATPAPCTDGGGPGGAGGVCVCRQRAVT